MGVISIFLWMAAMMHGCGGSLTGGIPAAEPSNAGVVSPIRQMTARRAAHTATLMPDGKVLIAGGFTDGGSSISGAEVFDPAAGSFSATGNMAATRAGHTATLLPNGKVLIAGGFNGNYLDTAEIYDPSTRQFSRAGRMTMPRSGHVAVALDVGKVLLAGGVGTGWTFLKDAEIYDPASNTFTATGSMTTPRESHTATLLKDGRVLITGGHRGRRAAITIYSSTEIYDPSSGTFTAAADLTVKRHKHDAARLVDGRVVITGGSDERDSRGAYTSAEIYDPAKNRFSKAGDMKLSRYKLQGTTILLKNGRILIAGGADRAEVLDPVSSTFELAAGRFESMRLFATATLLKNGEVLIAGGYDENQAVSPRAWIYREGS
jgi:hypothetical protein